VFRELRCIAVTSIVHSKLVYCNFLYYNLPNCQLNIFQHIQNSCLAPAVLNVHTTFSHTLLFSYSPISSLAKNQLILHTKFLLLTNIRICTYSSKLISVQPLAEFILHPSSLPSLHHPHFFLLKSQIAHSCMHHPRLWYKLPASFRQPHPNDSSSHSFYCTHLVSPAPSSPQLSPSITNTLCRSILKT